MELNGALYRLSHLKANQEGSRSGNVEMLSLPPQVVFKVQSGGLSGYSTQRTYRCSLPPRLGILSIHIQMTQTVKIMKLWHKVTYRTNH